MRIDNLQDELKAIGKKYKVELGTLEETETLKITLTDMLNYTSVIASVSETKANVINTDYPIFTVLDFNLSRDILKPLVGYARTPVDLRRKEATRYIVPLPGLVTTDGRQQFLTHKLGNFFACGRKGELRQTWKEKDLEHIPEEYRKYAVELSSVEQELSNE